MDTPTDTKKLQINLSQRAPVSIKANDWPRIATAYWFDGEHECQANRKAKIVVREHDDGRRIVYGWTSSAWRGERDEHAGYIVAATPAAQTDDRDARTVAAIERVGEEIGKPDLARDCIADMPAEELE